MNMYAEMKLSVVDHTKGKAELQGVDDQRKVFVYLLAMCSLATPMAELSLLHDYLRCHEMQNPAEQLVVSNMQVDSRTHSNRLVSSSSSKK